MNQPTQSAQNSFLGNAEIEPVLVQPRVRVGRRSSDHKETKIKLNKNGTTIESIHITCACGEEIVVECVYSDAKS